MANEHVARVLKKMCLYLSSQHNNMKNNNLVSELMEKAFQQLLLEMSFFEVTVDNPLSNNDNTRGSPPTKESVETHEAAITSTGRDLNNVQKYKDSPSSSKISQSPAASVSEPTMVDELICIKEEVQYSSGKEDPVIVLDDENTDLRPSSLPVLSPTFSDISSDVIIGGKVTDSRQRKPTSEEHFMFGNQNQYPSQVAGKRSFERFQNELATTSMQFSNVYTRSPQNQPTRTSLANKKSNQTFPRSYNVNKNLTKPATGEKSFPCQVCNKSFQKSQTLKQHMRLHTGEKPYKCQLCQQKFAFLSSYNVHMRTHTGERPFSCNLCNATFINSSNLKVHIRTHTKEKIFKCKFCDKKFQYNITLKSHISKDHSNELYTSE